MLDGAAPLISGGPSTAPRRGRTTSTGVADPGRVGLAFVNRPALVTLAGPAEHARVVEPSCAR